MRLSKGCWYVFDPIDDVFSFTGDVTFVGHFIVPRGRLPSGTVPQKTIIVFAPQVVRFNPSFFAFISFAFP